MPLLTRRRFLLGAAATAAAGAATGLPRAALADPGEVTPEPVEIVVPDLDPAHDGLRVAQLSDLHVGPLTPPERIRAAIAEANRFRPDLVVLTGDYLTRDRAGVALMREQLGGLEAPTVATLGNHDRWVDPDGAADALEQLGYGVLRNENTTLTLRHAPFTVVGIDDLWTRSADPPKAMKGAAPGSRLYLAHVPKTANLLANWGKPMLVLSGHTHGGQVNVPLLMPAVRWILFERFTDGLYQVEKVQLYVNRGIGNVGTAIRFNASPEVSLLTLRSGAAVGQQPG
ncbi:MAG TPA: metallophosphoesterase [Anaeromyxobacteraceae bacterium]|nr:metallophosphoesterase [Anaeromyxobacteraceae bacterium]